MGKRPSKSNEFNRDSLLNKAIQKSVTLFNGKEQVTMNQARLHCGSVLLMFVAVYCTFGALTSAFAIAINTGYLVVTWVFSAILITIVSARFRMKGLLLLFIPVLLIVLIDPTPILYGGMWVINMITYKYSQWLPIVAAFPEVTIYANEPTLFVLVAGVVVIFLLGFTICLRRSVFMTAFVTAPFVFLTFVVTTTQADIIYLLGLVAVYLTLLICSVISPDNFIKRAQLAIPAFIIAMVIMSLTYAITPHGNHTRDENVVALGNRFRTVASQMHRIGEFFRFVPADGMDVGWFGLFGGGTWRFNTENVSIADAGSRNMTGRSLLEITVNEPGTFYLRGYSMRYFDGRSWTNHATRSAPHRERAALSRPAYIAELYASLFPDSAPPVVEMEIVRTGDFTQNITYQPYYTADFMSDDNVLSNVERFYYISGSIHVLVRAIEREIYERYLAIEDFRQNHHFGQNVDETGLSRYAQQVVDVYRFFESNVFQGGSSSAFYDMSGELIVETSYVIATDNAFFRLPQMSPTLQTSLSLLATEPERAFMLERYTQIDEFTAQELRNMALHAGIDLNAERSEIADAVARFIRSSGSYTLTPGPVPQDENFTLYFLQHLQEGFCIHFATAGVLMLRSLDIPARFVSGYAIRISADEVGRPITVTDRNAHAWVEVYYNDVGWLYLEVTPSAGNTYVPPPRPHAPSNVTPTPTPLPSPTPPPEDDPMLQNGAPHNGALYNGAPHGADAGGREAFMPQWLQSMINIILFITATIIILVLRRFVMRRYRELRFSEKNTNTAVIYAWHYISKLSRNESIAPNDIEDLALKARFSQHRITEEERTRVVKYARRLAFEVHNGKDGLGRLWLGYIRALC